MLVLTYYYSFLGDYLIFQEVPNALEVAGVGLIFLNNVIVIFQNWESVGESKPD